MTHNTAGWDRILRALSGVALLTWSIMTPLPPLLRWLALPGGAIYMIATALIGTCLGYKLIGVSTCPVKQRAR